MKDEVLVPIGNARRYLTPIGMVPLCKDQLLRLYLGKERVVPRFKLVFGEGNAVVLNPHALCGILSGPVFPRYLLPDIKGRMRGFSFSNVDLYTIKVTGLKKHENPWYFPAPSKNVIFSDVKAFQKSS